MLRYNHPRILLKLSHTDVPLQPMSWDVSSSDVAIILPRAIDIKDPLPLFNKCYATMHHSDFTSNQQQQELPHDDEQREQEQYHQHHPHERNLSDSVQQESTAFPQSTVPTEHISPGISPHHSSSQRTQPLVASFSTGFAIPSSETHLVAAHLLQLRNTQQQQIQPDQGTTSFDYLPVDSQSITRTQEIERTQPTATQQSLSSYVDPSIFLRRALNESASGTSSAGTVGTAYSGGRAARDRSPTNPGRAHRFCHVCKHVS